MATSQIFEPMNHSRFFNKKFCALTFIALACLSVFISLGVWQLNRGLEKKLLLEQKHTQTHQSELNESKLNTLMPNPSLNWQKISLDGEFDNEHLFLIENKRYRDQMGYHIIVPIKTSSGYFLVNRGWMPKPNNDERFKLAPITDKVTIRGHLYWPKHNWFIFTNAPKEHAWPMKVLEVDIPAFEQVLNYKLYPMVVNLHSDSNHALIIPTTSHELLTPERHWGYAAQWFSFAALLIGLYFILTLRAWRKTHANH